MKSIKVTIKILGFVAIMLQCTTLSAQNSPQPLENLKNGLNSDFFNIGMVIQSNFRYSFEDDNFEGGRTFQVPNARIDFKGNVGGGYFYRAHFNLVKEPNLLDAYMGYKYDNRLTIIVGKQKPTQSLDFILTPQDYDFLDRAKIIKRLVAFRELGISARGTLGDLYYYIGLFNGSDMSNNPSNSFYSIGRLQYTIKNVGPGEIKLGISGSKGDGEVNRVSTNGSNYRVTERNILGTDIQINADKWLFRAEYTHSWLESNSPQSTVFPNLEEELFGYYFTAGYNVSKELMLVGRFQGWNRELDAKDNYQTTVGLKYLATTNISFRLNLDVYSPDLGDRKMGIGAMMQFRF